jgi:tRNA threonylcarbamoyladenosine biosynthesis protein TsaB
MNILGFDTSMGACSAAVAAGAGSGAARLFRRFEAMDRGQAERLMPMIEEVLRDSGLRLSDIDRIAATNGPGTFTGTRISVAAARALALAAAKPVVAFSSLEAVAHNPKLRPENARDLVVAMNANRGEAYAQVFDASSRTAKSEPLLIPLSDCSRLSLSGPVLVAGTAAEHVTVTIEKSGVAVICGPVAVQPDISDCLEAAALRVPLALPLKPLYLRPPDAKPQVGKSLARSV